jgi:hypothetical protein
MSRPKKNELNSMSIVELIDKLIWDKSYSQNYRDRLIFLMAQTETNSVENLLFDDLSESGKEISSAGNGQDQHPPPDYRALLASRKMGSNHVNFAHAILNSEWNKMDPRGKMYTAPDEVEGFLRHIVDNAIPYEEMNPSQQRLADTIAHSFGAWLRTQR